MELGLHAARKLLLDIANLGLPIATEFLDPIVPQYTADLVSWSAIGARTTESQTHREMSSGLSRPVGFKNATDGNIEIAINAIESASNPHSFLGIDQEGHSAMVKTAGNPNTHLVLRGGKGPNFQYPEVTYAACKLEEAGLEPSLMVDCSHANANKVARNQVKVWESIQKQRARGNCPITGVMVESFIKEGNQKISDNMEYGLSITDQCIDWETTEKIFLGE
jgi:3-deoxy-7-phosphoheptulonate synthase